MEASRELALRQRVRHHAEALNPLFDPTPFMPSDRLFEFVCTLVRAGGIEDAEWDPWDESKATLNDLSNLAKIDLPKDLFPYPDRTRPNGSDLILSPNRDGRAIRIGNEPA